LQSMEVRLTIRQPIGSSTTLSDILYNRTRTEKINLEVLTLTYGTLVSQLTHDLRDPLTNLPNYTLINAELDRMGHSIGLRLIEDFLAKTSSAGPAPCNNFRETAEMIAKVGFKIFLNVTPRVENWDKEGRSFGLVFEEMPVSEFVELPDDGKAQEELWFLNLFCGVVRGALEMVSLVFILSLFRLEVVRCHVLWQRRMLVRVCWLTCCFRFRCRSRRSGSVMY